MYLKVRDHGVRKLRKNKTGILATIYRLKMSNDNLVRYLRVIIEKLYVERYSRSFPSASTEF